MLFIVAYSIDVNVLGSGWVQVERQICYPRTKGVSMGGDDLDDGLLWEPVVAARDDASLSATSASDEEGDEGDGVVVAAATSKKRKQQPTTTGTEEASSKKKKGKKHSPAQLLLQAGRGIEREDKIHQAAFLTTALLQHYNLLEQQQNGKKKDGSNDNRLEVLPSYCVGQTFDGSENSTLVDRVRAAISVKKIKTWKHVGSPCVLIVCISARRAVAALKELASLKVRAAKLFPKNGSVEEQRQQLSGAAVGMAVGTPHRLLQLMASSAGDSDDGPQQRQQQLTLDRTQLVVLDCQLSHKQFTVCTLPDTAPHCMKLVRDSVLPQLKKRKDCKIAFF